MVRFSYFHSENADCWVVSGQLYGSCVDALRSVWQCFRDHSPRGIAIVALKNLTYVDEAGKRLLADMQKAGVKIIVRSPERKNRRRSEGAIESRYTKKDDTSPS